MSLQVTPEALDALATELARLREENDRLRDYAAHRMGCALIPIAPHKLIGGQCTCGLKELLNNKP